jgi:hypothetical protein
VLAIVLWTSVRSGAVFWNLRQNWNLRVRWWSRMWSARCSRYSLRETTAGRCNPFKRQSCTIVSARSWSPVAKATYRSSRERYSPVELLDAIQLRHGRLARDGADHSGIRSYLHIHLDVG